jgi:hypothetical protein
MQLLPSIGFSGQANSSASATRKLPGSYDVTLLLKPIFRWIVGALDSAWVAVAKYLRLTAPHKLPDFYEMWGTNAEWNGTSTPVGGGDAQERIAFEPNLLFKLGFTGV